MSVRFAVEQRAMFDVLFGAGLEKQRYPQLAASAGRFLDTLLSAVRPLTPSRGDEQAWALVQATVALAQGHALLLDGTSGAPAADVVEAAAAQAAAATRALVRGRSLILSALR